VNIELFKMLYINEARFDYKIYPEKGFKFDKFDGKEDAKNISVFLIRQHGIFKIKVLECNKFPLEKGSEGRNIGMKIQITLVDGHQDFKILQLVGVHLRSGDGGDAVLQRKIELDELNNQLSVQHKDNKDNKYYNHDWIVFGDFN